MKNLRETYRADLEQITDYLNEIVDGHPIAKEVCKYLFSKPGKNLRTLLLFIIGSNDKKDILVKLGIIISLIHHATLLHDDVIDQSLTRRDQLTVNAFWSNRISILVGDFLLAKAFDILIELNLVEVMVEISKSIKNIIYGELEHIKLQEQLVREQDYENIIVHKTSSLFILSANIAGRIMQYDESKIQMLDKFAKHLGIAFQISDDLLDYDRNCPLGKDCGEDFREGKITYPTLIAMQSNIQLDFWKRTLLEKDQEVGDFQTAYKLLQKSGAFETSIRRVIEHSKLAVQAILELDHPNFNQLVEFASFPLKRIEDSVFVDEIPENSISLTCG